MPCQYEDDSFTIRRLYDDLNKLTRVSCDMRTIIRRAGLETELTVEARNWIKQHDEEDKKRIQKEIEQNIRNTRRQEALDKLTLEDRRVLGL